MREISEFIERIISNLNLPDTNLVACLKEARMVANNFKDREFVQWIDFELNGYRRDDGKDTFLKDIPKYRHIRATPYIQKMEGNPYLNPRPRIELLKPIDPFPWFSSVIEIQEYIDKAEDTAIKLTYTAENMRTIPIIIHKEDLRAIITNVNLRLLDYLQQKSIQNLPVQNLDLDKKFWKLIHTKLRKVAEAKFNDTYYADAVESAFKEVNKRVKEIVRSKTGKELDGKGLMFRAFQLDDPVIILDDLSTDTGRNIQEGYMHIFAGAMQGIRNPKAHDNIELGKTEAMHLIFLANILMNRLDDARII